VGGPSITETLERIIQQGKGGLVVLGDGSKVAEASSGGFSLQGAIFTPARLAELSKMDGGVILDDAWANITEAAVHFIPDGLIPTDETGARHRTAERMAAQTGKPVVAVSEGRKVATLFHEGQKIELASPTEVSAHVNQELQSLDRLRSRLDDAEAKLTRLEVAGISTYRSAVTVLQRAELVERVGRLVEARTLTMGDGGQIVYLQLNDLLSGVELTKRNVLRDYVKPLRANTVSRALERLTELQGQDLEDPGRVGKEVGFPDLDDLADPRGFRLLSQVGRLPDPVRDDIIKHFGSQARLLHATQGEMIEVEGVGEARAGQLRAYFDRLLSTVHEWEPVFD
jgi:diadenylate cyclase